MLVKLNDPVQFNLKGHYYDRNLICLPDTNLMIGWKRFAQFSGWGIRDDMQRKDHQQLKIGQLAVQAKDFGHNYYRLRLETRDNVMLCTVTINMIIFLYQFIKFKNRGTLGDPFGCITWDAPIRWGFFQQLTPRINRKIRIVAMVLMLHIYPVIWNGLLRP